MLGYKTYRARTLTEALTKMKLDLGPNAILLDQKEVKPKGIFALFKDPQIEVHGAISDKPNTSSYSRLFNVSKSQDSTQLRQKSNSDSNSSLIQKELAEIKEQLANLTMGKIKTDKDKSQKEYENLTLNRFREIMKENDIGDDIIGKILEAIEKEIDVSLIDDDRVIKEKIKRKMMDLVDTTGAINIEGKQARVFVLVGPTGMGKTTSLVKIAANYKLKQQKEIEIISLDNYRIGASEQLKAYADIMQSPFKKVANKKELRDAVKKSKANLILIDTAGRSPQDDMSISMLDDYIKELNLHYVDIFLVMSANIKNRDMLEISKKYSQINYKYLLFTKIDETLSTGALFDAAYRIKKPISFITFGQDVPKDIDIASPENIIKFALQEF